MHLNRLMQYYAYVLITNLRKTKDTTMSNVCVKFDAIDKMQVFFFWRSISCERIVFISTKIL